MNAPSGKIVSLKAKLSSNGMIHSGIIEKLTGNTLFVTAASKNATSDFNPGKLLNINFQSQSGDTVCLSCKIKWSYKTPPHGITDSLGIEIIEPDNHYRELFHTL